MTNEFKALMQLVGAAAQGKAVSGLPDDLDWQKIERLADEQAVQTLLGYALKLSPGLACPEELRKRQIGQMRQLAFSNNAWKVSILRLIQQMNDAGIPALLIKGYAVADCYAAPDCRMSGDTDLLIEPKNEKRACAFMKANGFAVERRWTNGHHDVCRHPQLGCVELHVMLYDEIVEDVWFGRMDGREFVCESAIEVATQDGSYRTLGYTDHMIFLMLHLIKHFIMTVSHKMRMNLCLQHFNLQKALLFLTLFSFLCHQTNLFDQRCQAVRKYIDFMRLIFPFIEYKLQRAFCFFDLLSDARDRPCQAT